MLETFLFSERAVMPIVILIFFGYGVKRITNRFDVDFFKKLNTANFRVFLPIQLFMNITAIEGLGTFNGFVLLYILLGIIFGIVVGVLVAKHFIPQPEEKGPVAQGVFRTNQIAIGLAIATAISGPQAASFASMATMICVPMYNMFGVIVLMYFSNTEHGKGAIKSSALKIIKNPLILGTIVGMVGLAAKSAFPFHISDTFPSIYKALSDIAKMTSPLVLFTLGGLLDLSYVSEKSRSIIIAVLLRILIMPSITIAGAVLLRNVLNFNAVEMAVIVSTAASPVGTSTVAMVQEIGGDEQLASQIVVWSNVFSLFTLFIFIFALRLVGIL